MALSERNCDHCGKKYLADSRNLKRGWGLTCSKSCAALKRQNKSNKNSKFKSLKLSKERRVFDEFGRSLYIVKPFENDYGFGIDSFGNDI